MTEERPGGKNRKPDSGDSGFRVEDKRRFVESDSSSPQNLKDESESLRSEPLDLPGGGVLESEQPPADAQLPVRFDDLVRPFLLMGFSGLGIIPDPETGQPRISLVVARNAIDALELLGQKTEYHRTEDETKMLQEALMELRMQFVALQERINKK